MSNPRIHRPEAAYDPRHSPATPFDPVLLEIMRNRFTGIAEEMIQVLIRTAYSTNIKDRRDCSTALATPGGEIVAQTEIGTPLHMGNMPGAIGTVLAKYPLTELRPGDRVITNLPYPEGPGHLPDVTMVSAVWHNDRPVALAASTAHHVDMGGYAPGSMPFGVYEIYQEGLQIPPLKIVREGRINRDLLELIQQNVRTTDETLGDLMAQVAAAHVADRRMGEMITKYGLDAVQAYGRHLLDYAERRMRAALAQLPEGVYRFEDYLEGDGFDTKPIKIAATLTVRGGEAGVDFTGTDPQVRGPMNARMSAAKSAVYYTFKAVLDPELPTSSGSYRPIKVVVPEGSLLQARFPAAVGNANILTDPRIVDVLLGALAQAVPEKVCAACSGEMNLVNLGGMWRGAGTQPRPKTDRSDAPPTLYFNYVETYGGGQGAMRGLDGMDGVHTHLTNTRNAPVEAIETFYPLRVERYGLVPDSEGPGRWRGGCGMVRELTLLADTTTFSLSADRRELRPWGLDGGGAAGGSDCRLIHPDGSEEQLPSKVTTVLKRGDRLRITTPGGGGWGEPRQRDADAVKHDVAEGLIAPERAREVYGLEPADAPKP